ncbi:histidine--tRNA ligase [SAR86 cluster bacterium]|uniref:Histidine--tRNA ligase n=1 Tax=SAR86 cluster bacterium TaxID=2030880 RepID=A0A9Q8TYS8_9GAMM|nr:histidine--tRNA ligase [SAR86 cluster bacterium]
MSDLKTIRGMPDLYGKDIEAISLIEKTCKEVFLAFNYSEIRTPLIEYKSLFERSVGESSEIIQQKEVFELDDRKGEMLCLRPEGTAGLVRSLITNGLDDEEIKKFFYIGPMFRYERPQKGRKRQFFQAGVELIGNAIYGDLEVIQVANMILDKLGIESNLEINFLGDNESLKAYNKYLDDYLSKSNEVPEYVKKNPIRALDSKDEKVKILMSEAKSIESFLNEKQKNKFSDIKNKLNELNINFGENKNLVRGLDYYNGLVFEFTSSELGAQNAIIGGGRYDGLIESLGGRNLPATGFALGIDRLSEIIKSSLLRKDVFIGYVDESSVPYAQKIGSQLRSINSELVIENYLGNANVSKQLKKANSQGFKFAIIVGQEEIKAEKVKLKYLKDDKEDVECTIDELVEFLND